MREVVVRIANLVVLLSLTFVATSRAATLSLDDFQRLAESSHPGLKAVQGQTRQAEAQMREVRSAYWPSVDARAGYTAQLEAQAIVTAAGAQPTQEESYPFWSVAAEQTLYDFGRTGGRVERGVALAAAAHADEASYRQELRFAVVEAFYRVLTAQALLEAAAEEVAQMSDHRRIAGVLLAEGVVTRNDLLQAEVKQADSEQRRLERENACNNAWLQLNLLTGRAVAARDELLAPPPEKTAEYDPLQRPQLAASRARLLAAQAERRQSRSRFWPQLYARAEANYLENRYVQEQTIYAGTVGLRVNLFDGFASQAAVSRADAARDESSARLAEATLRARLDYETARNDAAAAAARVPVLAAAIAAGEENLRINRERYAAQTGTATEVIDAQTQLTQTRANYWQAFYDQQLALARVRRAAGQL